MAVSKTPPGITVSAAASHVIDEQNKLNQDLTMINQAKGSPDAMNQLMDKLPGIQKDWETFKADAAGLQNTGKYEDQVVAGSVYKDADATFGDTQGALKEVLGAHGDDPNFGAVQSNVQSIIDQGNAIGLHASTNQANTAGLSNSGEVQHIYAGGTRDPNSVVAQDASETPQN